MSRDVQYITVTDGAGKTMAVAESGGFLYPPFQKHGLLYAKEIKARPDDTLLVAYSKSGTHWLFEILRLLQAGTVDIERKEKDAYMIETKEPEKGDSLPSPRILNSHYHPDDLSPDFIAKKCPIIYMIRDPRDIIVSYHIHHKKMGDFFKYDGEFKDFIFQFMEGNLDYGSWFEYTKKWEKVFEDNPDIPLFVLKYESMKENPLENIRKINDFMGYKNSEEFLKQVVDKSSIETMKKERNKAGDFMGNIMYRKGIIGDWKNHFTVAQSEVFDEFFDKTMAGTKAFDLYSRKDEDKH